jgi:methionyl-tRNA formyltransferase
MEVLEIMIRNVVSILKAGERPAIKQRGDKATYCAKRVPEDGFIVWTEPAEAIDRLVRATTKPYPGAFTFANGRKIIVWRTDFHLARPYSAQPGQILYFEDGKPVVHCGDGVDLILSDIELAADGKRHLGDVLMAHQRLGFPYPWMTQ